MDNLLGEAVSLTMFGMGFVFVFLTLMVFLTTIMSSLIQKFQPSVASAGSAPTQSANVIDDDTMSIIKKAIKIHTGA